MLTPRKRLRGLAGAAVSVVSLAAVVWWASRQNAPPLPRSGSAAAFLVGALAVFAAATAIRGWRWHRILALAGVRHRASDAYALTAVGYMGSTVLPARGGEVLRVVLLGQRSSARARDVVGSIVAERLLDVVVLGCLFAVVTALGVGVMPGGDAPAAVLAGGVLAAAAAVVTARALRRRGRLERAARALRPFAHASRLLVGLRGLPPLAATALVAMLDAVTFWLVGQSIDLELGLLEAVFLLVLVTFATAIPAAPGFVGTFDGALVFGLAALDVPGARALAYVLLVRFVFFVPVTAVGALLLVLRYGGLDRLRERGRRRAAIQSEEGERPAR
jgi:glycosyltransferase 2 family protein